ncbi:MAG: type II toxin-antitoxin system RelE/ParE family toxin [Gammaproteobacteria bacterium]|jgi:putative addiction module killer protein|nr:type II toxin-antitoxin system RelE/ParE family toxin [Gammaproteobacteria bacterium]MDH3933724.1 type II toxin-antitoxin system RelE/ParE family toxin [Gammaproteobacteria bacterium]MDH3985981.1 type II toxin-antitoxin system RelE/ParE family toxin [Gammaproteobacteria bacterium]
MDNSTEVREYLDAKGNSPYAKWFGRLNVPAAIKVATAIHRVAQGNCSNVKGVGAGVYEYRIDFGPGYRIYFGRDGDRLVILLAGGTKKRQHVDITTAKTRWRDYKRRRRQGV